VDGQRIGCVRVSTLDQNEKRQLEVQDLDPEHGVKGVAASSGKGYEAWLSRLPSPRFRSLQGRSCA
jgi:hypothetical protein